MVELEKVIKTDDESLFEIIGGSDEEIEKLQTAPYLFQ